MMKGTSLASTVTIMDLTGVAKYIISTTFKPIEVFIVAGGIYLFTISLFCILKRFDLTGIPILFEELFPVFWNIIISIFKI